MIAGNELCHLINIQIDNYHLFYIVIKILRRGICLSDVYCKTGNTSNVIYPFERKRSVDVNVSNSRRNCIENNRIKVFVVESNRIEAHLNHFSPTQLKCENECLSV